MLREDLIDRLVRLDEDVSLLYGNEKKFRMVIVGGGALVLLEKLSRATHDIDVLDISIEIHPLLRKYDINCNVQSYINNFPYNYLDRLHKLDIEGQAMEFYTASLEDIVIAKLYSVRDSDARDIEAPEVVSSIDWDKLEMLALDENEAQASRLNDRLYQEFLVSYYQYKERFRK